MARVAESVVVLAAWMAGVARVVVAGRVVGWGARVDGGGSGWLGWHGWWWLGGWSWRVAELVVEGVIVGGWRWVGGAKALAWEGSASLW